MIDTGLLGCAIFQTIGTNISLLLSDPELDPHIWAQIAVKCDQTNSVLTQCQLRTRWFQNEDNVQDTYYAICASEGIVVSNRVDDDGSFEVDIMCACIPAQIFLKRSELRLCSTCDHWFHTPCQEVALIPFVDVKWSCPKCSNSNGWKFNCEVTYTVIPTLDPFYGDSVVLQKVMPSGIFNTGVSFQEKMSVQEMHKALANNAVESCEILVTDSYNKSEDNQELPNSIDTFLNDGIKCVDLLRNDDMKGKADQQYSIFSSNDGDIQILAGGERKDGMENFTESGQPVLETFSFQIEKSIWNEIKPVCCNPRARLYMLRFKMRSGLWRTKFRDGLSSTVPLIEMRKCLVRFQGHEVKMGEAAEYYVQASAYCVRVGCSMVYQLTISKQPEPAADFVEVNVKASGNLSHNISQREKRKLAEENYTEEKKVCHDLSKTNDKRKYEILPEDTDELPMECSNKLHCQNDLLEEIIFNDPLEDSSEPTEESEPEADPIFATEARSPSESNTPGPSRNFRYKSSINSTETNERQTRRTLFLKNFEEIKVVPQNGEIEYQNNRYPIWFTCSADTVLQGIHTLCKLNPASHQYLEELALSRFPRMRFLLDAIRYVEETKFDGAKQIFFNLFMEYTFEVSCNTEYLNAYNSQETFFLKMKDTICLSQDYSCPVETCSIPKQNTIYPLVDTGCYNCCKDFDLSKLFMETIQLDRCDDTHSSVNRSCPTVRLSWSPSGPPPFFIIPIPQGTDSLRIQESNLPLNINILGIRYKLCLYTVHQTRHFYNVVILNGSRAIVDGLHPSGPKDFQPARGKHLISSVWFLREWAD